LLAVLKSIWVAWLGLVNNNEVVKLHEMALLLWEKCAYEWRFEGVGIAWDGDEVGMMSLRRPLIVNRGGGIIDMF